MVAEVVFIENTQARIFHLPSDTKKVAGDHVVLQGNGKMLIPSTRNKEGEFKSEDGKTTTLNLVDKKYWDRKKNNACVKSWIKLEYIKLHDASAPGADMPDTLAKYNNTTAITLVEGEDNVALLKQWADTEMRDDVAAALSTRLSSLEKKKG